MAVLFLVFISLPDSDAFKADGGGLLQNLPELSPQQTRRNQRSGCRKQNCRKHETQFMQIFQSVFLPRSMQHDIQNKLNDRRKKSKCLLGLFLHRTSCVGHGPEPPCLHWADGAAVVRAGPENPYPVWGSQAVSLPIRGKGTLRGCFAAAHGQRFYCSLKSIARPAWFIVFLILSLSQESSGESSSRFFVLSRCVRSTAQASSASRMRHASIIAWCSSMDLKELSSVLG